MKRTISILDSFNFLVEMIHSNTVVLVFAFDALVAFFQKYASQIPLECPMNLLKHCLGNDYGWTASRSAGSLCVLVVRAQDILKLLTDNLIYAVIELGRQILGDKFPFPAVLRIILPFLPVCRDFGVCNSIYSFSASAAKMGKRETGVLDGIMHVFINVIAVPYEDLHKLEPHVINSDYFLFGTMTGISLRMFERRSREASSFREIAHNSHDFNCACLINCLLLNN